MNKHTPHGKNLAIGLVVLMGLVLIATVFNFTDEHIDVGMSAEDIIAVAESGDEDKIRELAQTYGWTEEDVVAIATQLKEEKAYHDAMVAREATLGTWEDALKNGNLMRSHDYTRNDELRTANEYDVTGDSLGDFEITFVDGKPVYWRFMDDKGQAYG